MFHAEMQRRCRNPEKTPGRHLENIFMPLPGVQSFAGQKNY
jgi:hypothetical protein